MSIEEIGSMENATEHKFPYGSPKNYEPRISDGMPMYAVYFVLGVTGGLVKIGYATDPWKRFSSMQTGSPEVLKMIGLIPTMLPLELERQLHERFAQARIRGEWFTLTDEMFDYIEEFARDHWADVD